MPSLIKIILSILFFLCLLDMTYSYFQLVQFLALVGFSFLAYQLNKEGKQTEMAIYIALALLFQPFFKIALGRNLWNFVDVVVGTGLIISIFTGRQNTKNT